MSARVGVLVFPGTNSEDETLRILRDVGAEAEMVHWSRADTLRAYDAYVLPGGFAYEDRVRAGAIAAHDRMMEHVLDGAQRGKLVMGICNGAQILLEAGVVPGTAAGRPTAAFTHNAQRHFICRHVEIRLAVEPSRSPMLAALDPGAKIPAWAAHGQGRLAASPEHLREIADDALVAFTYVNGAPNGSALDAAGLLNREGNVLALMPHPERDAWNFQHPAASDGDALAPSGGAAFFRSFAAALR